MVTKNKFWKKQKMDLFTSRRCRCNDTTKGLVPSDAAERIQILNGLSLHGIWSKQVQTTRDNPFVKWQDGIHKKG
jgi:hypothetical protein